MATGTVGRTGSRVYATRRLVKGNYKGYDHRHGNDGRNTRAGYEVLASDIPLSFWGGIDEVTGTVIDTTHPLHGQNVHNKILCLPSGRGSCTASQGK